MSEELKPCPFCGDTPQVFTEHEGAVPESYRVQCYKLHHTHWFTSRKLAVEAWNTRTTIPSAKVEELAERLEKLLPPLREVTESEMMKYNERVRHIIELRKLIE